MADSKPVGSSTLLKTELKRIFDEGLLLSSYNIYSQFMPREMEAFILELVALEIALCPVRAAAAAACASHARLLAPPFAAAPMLTCTSRSLALGADALTCSAVFSCALLHWPTRC